MRRIEHWFQEASSADDKSIPPLGLKTGFADLDTHLQGGLQAGELTCLAARSGMGKTTLALNLARNIYHENQLSVCFFSSETRPESLVQRLLALESGLPVARLMGTLDTEQMTQVEAARTRFQARPFYLEQISDLDAVFAFLEAGEQTPALVVLDSLLTLIFDGPRPWLEQMQLGLTRLKAWALESQTHMVVTGLLNEAEASRIEEKLSLDDLAPACLRQICDNIVLLNHDGGERKEVTASLWLAKQRQGAQGQILLDYNRRLGYFSGLDF